MDGTTLEGMAATPDIGTDRLPYGLLLARLGHESTSRFRRSLKPLGLSPQEFMVLRQVEAIENASQTEIADALAIDYSNLATIAGGLCDRDLLMRTRDDADRRRYVLELTPEGKDLLVEGRDAILDGEEEMVSSLDEEQREQFWLLLRQVADGNQLCPEERACTEEVPKPPPVC